MKTSRRNWLWVGAFAALVTACGGGDDGNSAAASGTGTLRVQMTDAPACGFDHVYVTVDRVRVNASSSAGNGDANWVDIIPAVPQKIDLLSLTNGVLADLGQTALPAGQYQQVRLVLAQNQGGILANSVVPIGGSEQPLATPSAAQSGYKIIRPFTVEPNTLVDLVLDFNACKSIVQRGNGSYGLKPVVTATPTVVSGAIAGALAADEAGATVYAEQDGNIVKGTLADSSGQFVLTPLEQSLTSGNYDVVIVQNGYASGIVRSVPVTVNGTTTIATSAQPIALPGSAMRSVSGAATPASAQAEVSAVQTINGLNYEIDGVNANVDTGAYGLMLPAAAPLVGTYAGVLPIALAPANAAAGKYAITAASATGTLQSTPVNVSGGDQTNVNFGF